MSNPVFFPVRDGGRSLRGIMTFRHFGIPTARFERGSEVMVTKFGVTRFHSIMRVVRWLDNHPEVR